MSFLERLRMISLGQVGLTCFEQSIVVNISLFLYSQVFCIVLLCSESSKDYYSKLRFFKQKMFNYRRCSMTLVQHRKWLRWSVQCAGAGANCRDYDCFWKRRWRMGVPAGDMGILPPQSPYPTPPGPAPPLGYNHSIRPIPFSPKYKLSETKRRDGYVQFPNGCPWIRRTVILHHRGCPS